MNKQLYNKILYSISKSLNESLKQYPKVLYRCGELQDTDPVDVITFENYELKNVDVLDYVLSTYGYALSKNIKSQIQELIELTENDENNDEEYIRNVISLMIHELELNVWHVKIKSVIWLETKETVLDMYLYDSDEIDAYYTTPYIFTDLGGEGILFGYTERHPEKL